MGPGIGRSIGAGLRAAVRSWPAIGLLIGGWIAVFLIAVLCLGVTNPPPELFEEAPAADLGVAPVPAPAPTDPPAAAPDAGSTETPDSLFDEMQAPAAELPAAASAETSAPDDEEAQRNRIIGQWLGRAWPMVLLCALVILAANLWLSGGQIGYLVKQLQDGKAPLAEFWQTANRAFVPLLGATGLLAAAVGVLAIGIALLATALTLLGGVLPETVMNLLGLILGAALLAALIWILIRAAAFWFIAVVADRLGPLAGLKAGFRTTRKRFWPILALGLLALLISWGAWLPFMALDWVGMTFGGGLGGVLRLLGNVLGGLVSAFMGFAVSAAFIRFYLDVRAEARG